MKRAAKAERKRDPGIAPDGSAIGHLRTRKQPDQGRLAGAVDAENPEIVPGGERYRRVVQYDFAAGGGRVGLRDPVERNHSGTLSRRRSPRSSANPPSRDRMARVTRYERSSQCGW